MYNPSFPSNFPSTGVWEITYFDEYEKEYPLHKSRVFISEHMGQFKLLRDRSTYGWKYRVGEMDKWLLYSKWEKADLPFVSGQWRFYTWMSIIHLVKARFIKESVFS